MINNVTLMGRICSDIESRTTNSGKTVCNFRLAVDRAYSKGGNRETDFVPVVAWEGQATFLERYFKKGDMLALRGEIQTRNYEDKNGNKRTAFEVIAREVSFCGSKAETGTGNYNPAPVSAAAPAPSYQTAAPSDFEEITDDEDLPF